MKKQQKKLGNAFACLSLTDEPDPERVAKQQSKRAQKKLSRNSSNRQSDEDSSNQQPDSPGLAAALAAIEAAERASPAPVGSPAGTWQGSAASSPGSSSRWLCQEDLIFPQSGSTTPTTGSRPGSSGGGRCGSSSPLAGGDASRRAREEAALLWQSFAADCAAAAHASAAANDDDDDSQLQLAALSEADPVMFEQLMREAAALGLQPAELLRLQQEAVMQEAAAGSSASYCSRAAGCSREAAATSSRGRSSASRSQPPAAQSPESEFPALPVSPLRSPAAAAQGRPQHAVPHGWKGGRLAPKASKGVTVLNSRGSSGGGSGGCDLRPSSLDLHWDLCLDGLSLKQDPLEAAARGAGYEDAAAHARSAAAAEERAASREGAGGGSRDACSQETLRAMMHKAGGKAKGPGAAAQAAEAEQWAVGAGGKSYGYSWEELKDSVRAGGWVPVQKKDGAGGTHYKFRRVLPLSNITQTLTLPCTPSDSQRGVRNSASNLLKLDREREELEAAARAAGAAGGAAAVAGGVAGVQRRKCR